MAPQSRIAFEPKPRAGDPSCGHSNSEQVDEWWETDIDDLSYNNVEYQVVAFECCDCGRCWIDTTGEYR